MVKKITDWLLKHGLATATLLLNLFVATIIVTTYWVIAFIVDWAQVRL